MKNKKLSGAFGLLTDSLSEESPKHYDESEQRSQTAKDKVPSTGTNLTVSKPAPATQSRAPKAPKRQLVEIDPKRIRSWKYKDRTVQDLDDLEFQQLIDSIHHQGQHQPIGVRPIKSKDYDYEEIYGFRRLHACLSLGIKVWAIVDDFTNQRAFVAQIVENDDRTAPNFWRRSCAFKKALDDNLFPTVEALAAQSELARSTCSNYIRVAEGMREEFANELPLHKCRRDVLFFLLSLRFEPDYKIKGWLYKRHPWVYKTPIQLKEVKKDWEDYEQEVATEKDLKEMEDAKKNKAPKNKTYIGKAGKLFSINRKGETVTINILKDGKRIMTDEEIGEALQKIMDER